VALARPGAPALCRDTGASWTSIWDFPRPPRLPQNTCEVVVRWGDVEVARTRRAVLVLETAHPPSMYLPWHDAVRHLLQPAAGSEDW
jgi:uncharacterized protein (DUF427 family)